MVSHADAERAVSEVRVTVFEDLRSVGGGQGWPCGRIYGSRYRVLSVEFEAGPAYLVLFFDTYLPYLEAPIARKS